jgi:hypothetical protein
MPEQQDGPQQNYQPLQQIQPGGNANLPGAPQPKKSHKALWAMIIVVIIALIGAGIYMFLQIKPQEQVEQTKTDEKIIKTETYQPYNLGAKLVGFNLDTGIYKDLVDSLPAEANIIDTSMRDNKVQIIFNTEARFDSQNNVQVPEKIFAKVDTNEPYEIWQSKNGAELLSTTISTDNEVLLISEGFNNEKTNFVRAPIVRGGKPVTLVDDATILGLPLFYDQESKRALFQQISCLGCDAPLLPIIYELDTNSRELKKVFTLDDAGQNAGYNFVATSNARQFVLSESLDSPETKTSDQNPIDLLTYKNGSVTSRNIYKANKEASDKKTEPTKKAEESVAQTAPKLKAKLLGVNEKLLTFGKYEVTAEGNQSLRKIMVIDTSNPNNEVEFPITLAGNIYAIKINTVDGKHFIMQTVEMGEKYNLGVWTFDTENLDANKTPVFKNIDQVAVDQSIGESVVSYRDNLLPLVIEVK